MTNYTIGFIDEEEMQRILFMKSFEEKFNIELIDPQEIESPHELLQNIMDKGIDMLLIDFDMIDKLGYNADKLEEEIKEINPHFPLLIVTSQIEDALDYIQNPSIVYSKDIWFGEEKKSLSDFKLKLEKIIQSYRKQLENYETILKSLVEKMGNEGLSPEEEDEYVKMNKFLSETKSDFTSGSFYTTSTNEKLDSIIEKTEELLDKLSNNA